MNNIATIQDLFYAEQWLDFGVKIDYSSYDKVKQIRVYIDGYIYCIHFKFLHQAIFSTEHGRDTYYYIVADILNNIPDIKLAEIVTHFSFNCDVYELEMFTLCDNLTQYHQLYTVINENRA